ncbi:lipid A biosynthesis acyltransferase [Planctomycetales bacterium ZRK34]|nr:lipid A biosynthesis acyltransferase [Planctomycetales bacterium ZRK34]
MARNQSALTNWTQYLALRFAAAGLHMFSVDRNLASARGLGSLMYRWDKRHRHRAVHNIALAMPELDRREVHRIAEASMQHFLQLGVEVLYTPRLLQIDNWAERLHVGDIAEPLDLVLSNRPVIMATPHYGNWEVLGYAMAMLGVDLSAVARPIDNPLVNDYVLGVRERKGMKIITKWGASEVMTDVLERGGTLGFIADQNAGDKGMFVPYMGRLASTYKSIGLLAIRYDTPVVCGGARRLGNRFEYIFEVEDVIYPDDWADQPDPLYYLTARYNRAMERMILAHPDQYLWIHRRWRSRPRHEKQGKPMPRGLRTQLESLPWMTDELMNKLEHPPAELR